MEKFIKILIITVIVGFIGYFAYNKIINWHKKELVSAISQERNKFEEKTWQLEEEIRKLEEELALKKGNRSRAIIALSLRYNTSPQVFLRNDLRSNS